MKNTQSHPILKACLFVAMFGMLAYLTQGPLAFIFFSGLILMITLGRSVPLGMVSAVLFGACFPKTAALVAVLMAFYVLTHPTRSASTFH